MLTAVSSRYANWPDLAQFRLGIFVLGIDLLQNLAPSGESTEWLEDMNGHTYIFKFITDLFRKNFLESVP